MSYIAVVDAGVSEIEVSIFDAAGEKVARGRGECYVSD